MAQSSGGNVFFVGTSLERVGKAGDWAPLERRASAIGAPLERRPGAARMVRRRPATAQALAGSLSESWGSGSGGGPVPRFVRPFRRDGPSSRPQPRSRLRCTRCCVTTERGVNPRTSACSRSLVHHSVGCVYEAPPLRCACARTTAPRASPSREPNKARALRT